MRYFMLIITLLVLASLGCNLTSTTNDPTPIPAAFLSQDTSPTTDNNGQQDDSITAPDTETAQSQNDSSTQAEQSQSDTGSGGANGGSASDCVPNTAGLQAYVVQSGDTVTRLAARFGMTANDIISRNCLPRCQ